MEVMEYCPILFKNVITSNLQIFHVYLQHLGVCIESDLSWNTHITEICKKAKKIIGLIYRPSSNGQTIYPADKTSSGVWCSALERVQQFALRMCLGL